MICLKKYRSLIKNKLLGFGMPGKVIVRLFLKVKYFKDKRNFLKYANQHSCRIFYKKDKIEISKGNCIIILSLNQRVYLGDIVASFDQYFFSVAPAEINGEKVVDFSVIREHTLSDSGIIFFFSSIAEGEWPLRAYLKEYSPKEGDVVFDCGAYCGVSTYFFSKMVGESGKVYAFEPDDLNYEVLLKNIERHHLTNVIPVKKGLYSKRGEISFNNEGGTRWGSHKVCTEGAE